MTSPGGRLESVARLRRLLANVPPQRLFARARYELKQAALRKSPRRLREAVARVNEEPPDLRAGYLRKHMAPTAVDSTRTSGARAGHAASRDSIEVDVLGESVRLSEPIDWSAASKSRLWRFTLHYFDWAMPLAGAMFCLDGVPGEVREPRVHKEEAIRDALLSWIRANPYGTSDAWHPYPTARRLTSWTHLASTFPSLAGPEMERSMWLQLRHLANNIEWFAGGGHLLQNLSSLVVGGLRYQGPRAERIVSKVLHQLCVNLSRQILADGCHYELSSTYHLQNITRTAEVIACLMSAGHRPPFSLVDSLTRMTRFAESIRLPGNGYPLWSDAVRDSVHSIDVVLDFSKAVLRVCEGHDAGKHEEPREYGARRLPFPLDQLVESAASHGQLVVFPGVKDVRVRYPRLGSGLHVLRSADVSVAIDTANTGAPGLPGHGHADCLSVDLHLADRAVIIESGTSTYAATPDRARERGTASHNTIEVGGRDQSELWGSFRAGRVAVAIDQASGQTGGWSWVSGGHDGYMIRPHRTIHRRWVGVRHGDVVILDQLVMGSAGLATEFVARMHLAPGVDVRQLGRGSFRLGVGDGEMLLKFMGLAPDDEATMLDASTSCSFFAPGMGRKIPRGLMELRGRLRPGDSRYVAVAFSANAEDYDLRASAQDVELLVAGETAIRWRSADTPLVPAVGIVSDVFTGPRSNHPVDLTTDSVRT